MKLTILMAASLILAGCGREQPTSWHIEKRVRYHVICNGDGLEYQWFSSRTKAKDALQFYSTNGAPMMNTNSFYDRYKRTLVSVHFNL